MADDVTKTTINETDVSWKKSIADVPAGAQVKVTVNGVDELIGTVPGGKVWDLMFDMRGRESDAS